MATRNIRVAILQRLGVSDFLQLDAGGVVSSSRRATSTGHGA